MIHTNRFQEILRRKPYLRGYLQPQEEEHRYRLLPARNGTPIVTLFPATDDPENRTRYLASRYDPDKEARRRLEGILPLRGTELVLILGLGNPQVMLGLLSQLKPNQISIAIDSSLEVGRLLCREHLGMIDYLERPGSHLFCGPEMLPSLWTYLESLPIERLSAVRVIRQPNPGEEEDRFYRECEERAVKIVQTRFSDILTRFEFEKKWIGNIIANSRHLPPRPADGLPSPATIRRLEGRLRGTPALLVAAGPSLRRSLPAVALLQKRAFVLCCDTAFKVLVNAGILPHAIVTLDSQKNTLFHFLGEPDLSRTVLFADLVTHPLVLRNIEPDGVVFSSTAKYGSTADGFSQREATPGTEHVERIHGPTGDIQSGGSVATTGFEILRFLGAEPIMLIGQDLAYSGREIHSTGTHHNERWLQLLSRVKSLEKINEEVIRRRKIRPVRALDGGETPADYVLDLYRHWFEDAIPRCGVRTLNLTAAGARIEGVDHIIDAEAFATTLPLLDNPAAPLRQTPGMEIYEHPLNHELFTALEELARQEGEKQGMDGARTNRRELVERILDKFPYLEELNRKTETYLNRNREKMTDAEIEKRREENMHRALLELGRFLRPYFGPHPS